MSPRVIPAVGTSGAAPLPARYWIGPACAAIGVFGFSVKAVLIKLVYLWHPMDAITLLALRMLYSAPLLIAMAWWASRRPGTVPLRRVDVLQQVALGFVGYYVASLFDFMALQYISAALERLILFLYPTLVVLFSALMLGTPVTRRTLGALALSYLGIVIVFWQDLKLAGDAGRMVLGGALVFGSAVFYALYLTLSGGVIRRIGSLRFIAGSMLASTFFVLLHFFATRDPALLAVPPRIHVTSAVMAVFSTVLPVWLIAEAIRRIGANSTSLVGAFGPIVTIAGGAMFLGEPIRTVQLLGAALVLIGVSLVVLKPPTADAATRSAT